MKKVRESQQRKEGDDDYREQTKMSHHEVIKLKDFLQ